MNKDLQTILNFVQSSVQLSDEEKAALLKAAKAADKELEITSFKLERTEKVKHTTAVLLEETIEELENKRKAIEEQNRELEIESSLEKVRAVAMGMRKRNDMLDICRTISQQLKSLGIKEIRNVQTAIFYTDKGTYVNYEYYRLHDKALVTEVDYTGDEISVEFAAQMIKGADEVFIRSLEGQQVKDWLNVQRTTNVFIDTNLENARSLTYYWFSLGPVAIGMSTYDPLSQEEITLFKRFRNVFDLAYRRYLDIEKAEAQAREAQIEAALEKIRSRSLAMHKSDELKDVVTVLFEKLRELGLDFDGTGIQLFIEGSKNSVLWIRGVILSAPVLVNHPYDEEAFVNSEILRDIWHAKEKAVPVFNKTYTFKEKNKLVEYTGKYNKGNEVSPEVVEAMMQATGYTATFIMEKNSGLWIDSWSGKQITVEEFNVSKRVAKVFEQAYVRFLDLQKAEAQAREARIEAALEKVRSSSLAMHNTSELQEVIHVVHKELLNLNIAINGGSFIAINSDIETTLRCWGSGGTANTSEEVHLPLYEKPFCTNLINGIKNGPAFFTEEYTQKEKKEFFTFLFKYEPWSKLDAKQKKEILSSPGGYTRSCCVSQHTSIFIINHFGEKFSATDNDILQRFGKVFEQTYTRFLDLQKAEAQARESQIQLALERVRARTMAMQRSDELREAVLVIYEQLQQLNFESRACNIIIIDKESSSAQYWVSGFSQEIFPESYTVPYLDHPYQDALLKPWKQGDKYVVYEYTGKMKQSFDEIFFTKTEFRNVPEDAKNVMIGLKSVTLSTAFISYGALQALGAEPLSEEKANILKRFAKVFEQTYTRFLDLQKAEAQARESQIQLALERVRARTMAMQHSNELAEAARVLYEEFRTLDINTFLCGYCFYKEEQDKQTVWVTLPDGTLIPDFIDFPITGDHVLNKRYEDWKQKKPLHVLEIKGEENKEHHRFLASKVSDQAANEIFAQIPDRIIVYGANFSTGYLFIIATELLTGEEEDVIIRFAKVFELTYTRFNDLKQAEAQAREAQIQLALERVRARTMAMQKSDELMEASNLLLQQVQSLGIPVWACGYNIWEIGEKVCTAWMSVLGAIQPSFRLPLTEHRTFIHMDESRLKAEASYVEEVSGEELADHYRYMFSLPDFREIATKQLQGSSFPLPQSQAHHVFNFKQGNLIFLSAEAIPEALDIFKRFTAVFEQTYTRFLDLQKAETQAREAKIEAALENVRSRSLAMHHSNELKEVVKRVFEKMKELGFFQNNSVMIVLPKNGFKDVLHWTFNEHFETMEYNIPAFNHSVSTDTYKAWKRGEKTFEIKLNKEEKDDFLYQIFKYTDYSKVPDEFKKHLYSTEAYNSFIVFENHCGLLVDTFTSVNYSEDQKDVVKRFAKVFEQAYIRFLDLQKAEAQAREAKIETALEKVRSRTMAMQHSDELANVATVLFQQVKALGVPQWTCGFSIFEIDDKEFTWYPGSVDGDILSPSKIPLTEHPVFIQFNESRKRGDELFVYEKKGEVQADHYRYMCSLPGTGEFLQKMLDAGLTFPDFQIDHLANFSHGNLIFITYEPFPEMHDVFKRFAKVFEQTYTRFLDLKKAEAQALEAIKRASVDRIRAEIASMRTTNDLERITPLIWNELTTLGVPFVRCGVFIMDEEKQLVETHLSTPDGKAIASFTSTFTGTQLLTEILPYWQRKEVYKVHWDEAMFLEQAKSLVEQGSITSGEKYLTENRPTDLYLHFLPFLQGMLYAGNTTPLSDDELQLMQNLADAFSTAYARYEDFNKLEVAKEQIEKTLVDLKQAQTQLVQSEKMASLGELTAGIAHEIQNPLNFVNNFSDVNKELLEELKEEADKGNIEEIKAIANDVINNEEKINHHGKRADAIVKNMLQHSRSSGATKELTDINKLADEYLRLSYHGLRAKDKSFNADFKTEFDESIAKIKIIPQDIGRVLLNLINNAFYATNEKKKTAGENYKPLVSVLTKKINNNIEIAVTDNGKGIPASIKEKIFQPFFTTKPTGQGTGLGLSLSYDIVKAHGGEIRVETKEGEGSEFVIQLPV